MDRPTITLALIAKDEANNVKRLFDSVEGVFDEIVFVDTGSTDGTVDIAKSLGASVYHFDWVNDFSAARNFSFSKVKTDYVMWMDLDDELHNKEALKDFIANSLKYFEYVLAKYHYAVDKDKKPIISFARERILKMSTNPTWNYFVHEGVKPPPNVRMHYCSNWAINHLRTEEDMKKDKSRNLNIFEEKKKLGKLDGRLTFYYGKELFENSDPERAIPVLLESVGMAIEPHDRILALQYACYAIQQVAEKLKPEHQGEKLTHAIDLAQKALLLAPNRAEFHSIIGDCYLKLGRLAEALPSYAAAKYCLGVAQPGDAFAPAIHSFKPLYQEYPRNQIAKILFNLNRFDEAKKEAEECFALFKNEETRKLLEEMAKIAPVVQMEGHRTKTTDIVFTCPPQSAYEFDEELYKTKGMGGSETGLIEVAKWLKKLTGRRVIVFNMRQKSLVSESGVEYFSTTELNNYFSKFEPAAHIAWRHNIRVTKAPSYLWSHDLMIQGVENGLNQDKVLCLSKFHRDFLASSQGVPRDRIVLTRNGIEPKRFAEKPSYKDQNHVVFASSPDRGLKECILILDKVRVTHPMVYLSVFYGRGNLRKYGQAALADELDKMIIERPWIKDYGMTEQNKMMDLVSSAGVWLHPTHFVETFCITALEMICLGVYPVTRRWGAIGNVLEGAEKLGFATLFDFGPDSESEKEKWAAEVVRVMESKAWEKVEVDPKKFAWSEVAKEWIEIMNIPAPSHSSVRTVEPELVL